jgi:hypothetical protein
MIPKTATEFNEKYKDYLEEGHYGMSLGNLDVLKYLDREFSEEIKQNPNFSYSQIKDKWSRSVIYAETLDPSIVYEWERAVDSINSISR